jgi:RNA polymerase sigma-70 factor (ECF subfamily)
MLKNTKPEAGGTKKKYKDNATFVKLFPSYVLERMKRADNYTLDLLIEGCINNEHAAQKVIYQRYAAKMFAVCLRYGKTKMVAEELLQTGFVKVFRSIVHFRKEGSFEGWIRRVMVNTAIEYYRQAAKIQETKELTPDLDPEGNYGSGLDNLALEDLMALIAALPDGYRMVFNMYAIEGYSHKEIAEKLGITEGGSKSQLSRARIVLQNAINKREEVAYARFEK